MIEIAENPSMVVAQRLADVAAAGGHVALSGSSTPRRSYELAAELADWSSATVWFVDDRAVGPDDENSNYKLVRESLLGELSADQQPRVFRMEGELGCDVAADRYETSLRGELGDRPRIDLLILGIGPDGHVASLFPDKPEIEERERSVVGVPEAGFKPFIPRMSLTLPVINAAREIIFLVTGESKAEIVARAFGPDRDADLPAARVQPTDGELRIVLDHAAAGGL